MNLTCIIITVKFVTFKCLSSKIFLCNCVLTIPIDFRSSLWFPLTYNVNCYKLEKIILEVFLKNMELMNFLSSYLRMFSFLPSFYIFNGIFATIKMILAKSLTSKNFVSLNYILGFLLVSLVFILFSIQMHQLIAFVLGLFLSMS